MLVGTDGNMWSCSDGLSLGDPRSKWVFERTLGEAVEKYRALYEPHAALRKDLYEFWHNTPEEYRAANAKLCGD